MIRDEQWYRELRAEPWWRDSTGQSTALACAEETFEQRHRRYMVDVAILGTTPLGAVLFVVGIVAAQFGYEIAGYPASAVGVAWLLYACARAARP